MITSGIYQIINRANGKFYLGSAVKLTKRFSQHKNDLRNNRHDNSYLQNAWNKYGEEAFEFIIVQLVLDKSTLDNVEQSWINWSNCCDREIGYNIRPNASNNSGHKFSQEARANMSKSHIGEKHSPERIENMRRALRGKKRTKEFSINLSNKLKGRAFTQEHKLNLKLARNKYLAEKRHGNA